MHVISKVRKRGKMVSCVIQDKYDMFRDVGPAASYLFSPHAILGIPVFPSWASPGKMSEMVSYGCNHL